MRKRILNTSIVAVLAALFLMPPYSSSSSADLYRYIELSNGIEAALCAPETILEHLTVRDTEGRLIFRPPGGGAYLFIEDTDDPTIVNKGDGSFHPMRLEEVLLALDEIDVGGMQIDCEIFVYVLPYPRYGLLRSSASGNSMFLSPGVYEPGSAFTAFTVTHEFGHVFQHTYAPDDGGERWETYLRIRGIAGDPRYSDYSEHRDRPREIFAEDFRYLFGGEWARYTQSIENPLLMLPDSVEGLCEFFVSLLSPVVASAPDGGTAPRSAIVSAVNYPNPFNPSTTIEIVLDGSAGASPREAELSVFRVDGSLIRTLFRGEMTGQVFRAGWDGRDGNGSMAPSGVYYYRMRVGADVVTGKMVLIR